MTERVRRTAEGDISNDFPCVYTPDSEGKRVLEGKIAQVNFFETVLQFKEEGDEFQVHVRRVDSSNRFLGNIELLIGTQYTGLRLRHFYRPSSKGGDYYPFWLKTDPDDSRVLVFSHLGMGHVLENNFQGEINSGYFSPSRLLLHCQANRIISLITQQ